VAPARPALQEARPISPPAPETVPTAVPAVVRAPLQPAPQHAAPRPVVTQGPAPRPQAPALVAPSAAPAPAAPPPAPIEVPAAPAPVLPPPTAPPLVIAPQMPHWPLFHLIWGLSRPGCRGEIAVHVFRPISESTDESQVGSEQPPKLARTAYSPTGSKAATQPATKNTSATTADDSRPTRC